MTENNYSARGAPHLTLLIPIECAGMRVDQALARLFPEHSRSRIAAWLKEGQILLDTRAVRPDVKVWGGESVDLTVPADPREAPPAAEAIRINVVHEDESVLVIDKPAGLVVHPGSGNWSGTLLNALLHHAPGLQQVPRAGIVHRLDKDTSGLLVVAKTLTAQTSLVRQLQARTVERTYLALVHGRVEGDGEVESPIGRDPRNRVRMAVVAAGKPALTRYRVQKQYAQMTLLECKLSTGRTHQIRVHLQSIGHPLVGDPVYRGAAKSAAAGMFKRQALHALRLAFVHPRSEARVEYQSAIPADLQRLLDSLS
jgi:23S rRNA pseudouridine1911/1915/1917 synthase